MSARKITYYLLLLFAVFTTLTLYGCAGKNDEKVTVSTQRIEESAQDADVDFTALKEINPDIFGWLYIPDTDIDCPILQCSGSDTYYETHNVYRETDDGGAAYIELANLPNMCDFNTVIHGNSTTSETGLFGDLYQFTDLDFFENHERLYLYLEDNVLTYEVFAVYERENTSLLRCYDFTDLSDCQTFLDTIYDTRDMNMKLREGWNFINPYHFLITLTTSKENNADTQLVVIAVLTQDAAGKIDRLIYE